MHVFEQHGIRFEYPPDATVEATEQDGAWSVQVQGPWRRGLGGAEGHPYWLNILRLPNADRWTASGWLTHRLVRGPDDPAWHEAVFAGHPAMRVDQDYGIRSTSIIVATTRWIWCIAWFEPPAALVDDAALAAGHRILDSLGIG